MRGTRSLKLNTESKQRTLFIRGTGWKNQYEFEAKQKGRQHSQSTQQRRVMIQKVVTPSPVPQLIMQEVLVSFAIPRQTPMIQRVRETVEVPQIQFIDKVVDAPVGVQNDPETELEIPTPVAWHCSARLMSINFPAPLGPNLFVLGEPVLHKYDTVFDWYAQEVGFGLSSSRRNVGKLVRQGREGSLHQESRCGREIEGDLCLLPLERWRETDAKRAQWPWNGV